MKTYSLSQPSALPPSKWQRFVAHRLPNIVVFLMVATFAVIVLYPFMVVTVPSGYVGVLWKRFGGFGIYCWCVVGRGTVLAPGELREEGLHIIWPWDHLFLYDLRLQTSTQTYNAISKDGVNLTATINIRFQLRHDSVGQLHKFIGPGYSEMVVGPEIGSRAREVISGFNAEEVYSTARQVVEDAIRKTAQERLAMHLDALVQPESSDQFQPQSPRMVRPDLSDAIQIRDTLVLGIELPQPVVAAINHKTEQLYIAQEYVFRIERERKESERKRIEAAGIRDFQQIVSQGISDSYVRWRGIEATLALAQSNNAKIVIIGGGREGLPVILGNVDTPTVPGTPPSGGAMPNEKPQNNNSLNVPLAQTPGVAVTTPEPQSPPFRFPWTTGSTNSATSPPPQHLPGWPAGPPQ
jgi:regulator of protease activity HflC (stomatin/prohibitin superfamily)